MRRRVKIGFWSKAFCLVTGEISKVAFEFPGRGFVWAAMAWLISVPLRKSE